MIRGMHAMFYSSEAEALRAFLRDKLQLPGTDVGGGWLIFAAPEAELGVHPTENPQPPSGTADISFYCDDIAPTVADQLGLVAESGADLLTASFTASTVSTMRKPNTRAFSFVAEPGVR